MIYLGTFHCVIKFKFLEKRAIFINAAHKRIRNSLLKIKSVLPIYIQFEKSPQITFEHMIDNESKCNGYG